VTTSITWLGSSAFRLSLADGKQVYLDPWLENSDCPASEREPERVDLIVLTHGHFDHVGQTMDLLRRFKPLSERAVFVYVALVFDGCAALLQR
jgi:L-ascorbate metabolism protein UlaG (beta-lactamase superfamily)